MTAIYVFFVFSFCFLGLCLIFTVIEFGVSELYDINKNPVLFPKRSFTLLFLALLLSTAASITSDIQYNNKISIGWAILFIFQITLFLAHAAIWLDTKSIKISPNLIITLTRGQDTIQKWQDITRIELKNLSLIKKIFFKNRLQSIPIKLQGSYHIIITFKDSTEIIVPYNLVAFHKFWDYLKIKSVKHNIPIEIRNDTRKNSQVKLQIN